MNLAEVFSANEERLKGITYGNYGVCAACYTLNHITKHHVRPRSVFSARDWNQCFIVHLCRPCHEAVHKAWSHADIVKRHTTLEAVISDIRQIRGIGQICAPGPAKTAVFQTPPNPAPDPQTGTLTPMTPSKRAKTHPEER